MNLLIIVYLFILGTIFGSFALAVVDRMHAKKDWVKSRSACDKCKRTLSAPDLVPIFSWLASKGKCRYCGYKLSPTYPLAEVGLGTAFALSYIFWPVQISSLQLSMFIVWLSALVLITMLFINDLRWFILPDKIMLPLAVLGAVWAILGLQAGFFSVPDLLYGVMVSAGLFLLLYLVSNGRWIGFGDVKLGVVMGLFLADWRLSWLAIMVASVSGILVSLPMLTKKKNTVKKSLKTKIPFGPMLLFALFFVMLFGQQIVDWYVMEFLQL